MGSPTKALELEAALPPPDIRFEKLCNMYAFFFFLIKRMQPYRLWRYQDKPSTEVALNQTQFESLNEF